MCFNDQSAQTHLLPLPLEILRESNSGWRADLRSKTSQFEGAQIEPKSTSNYPGKKVCRHVRAECGFIYFMSLFPCFNFVKQFI